jgi:hypothetical protein
VEIVVAEEVKLVTQPQDESVLVAREMPAGSASAWR